MSEIKLVWVKNPNGIIHQQPTDRTGQFTSLGAVVLTEQEAQAFEDQINGVITVEATPASPEAAKTETKPVPAAKTETK